MDLSKLDINSIAQDIDMGLHCHIHKKTLEVVSFLDPDEIYDNEELWEPLIKKVEDNPEDYIRIIKMDSRLSFGIMEDFTSTVKDKSLQAKLQHALNNRKPFRNWKHLIDQTGQEREDWFTFKQSRMEIWVQCHLEADDEIMAEKYYMRRAIVHLPALTGISRVVYKVGDMEEGLDWYTVVLNMYPTSNTEMQAIFEMDHHELVIEKGDVEEIHSESAAVVYWITENIDIVIMRLENAEGVEYIQSPETSAQKIKTCIIADPWGNAIGLMSYP